MSRNSSCFVKGVSVGRVKDSITLKVLISLFVIPFFLGSFVHAAEAPLSGQMSCPKTLSIDAAPVTREQVIALAKNLEALTAAIPKRPQINSKSDYDFLRSQIQKWELGFENLLNSLGLAYEKTVESVGSQFRWEAQYSNPQLKIALGEVPVSRYLLKPENSRNLKDVSKEGGFSTPMLRYFLGLGERMRKSGPKRKQSEFIIFGLREIYNDQAHAASIDLNWNGREQRVQKPAIVYSIGTFFAELLSSASLLKLHENSHSNKRLDILSPGNLMRFKLGGKGSLLTYSSLDELSTHLKELRYMKKHLAWSKPGDGIYDHFLIDEQSMSEARKSLTRELKLSMNILVKTRAAIQSLQRSLRVNAQVLVDIQKMQSSTFALKLHDFEFKVSGPFSSDDLGRIEIIWQNAIQVEDGSQVEKIKISSVQEFPRNLSLESFMTFLNELDRDILAAMDQVDNVRMQFRNLRD